MKTLITIQSIIELKESLPPLVREAIDITLLSKSYQYPMIPLSKFNSTFYYVQSTTRAMHLTPRRRDELSDELTYSVFNNIVSKIAELAPTLMRHSLDKDGNEVIPPYEVYQNKKDVVDYYIFPMCVGNSINDPSVRTFNGGDDCRSWQIGRKHLSIELLQYEGKLTENDYFDPQILIDTDWTEVTTKRPVGRPRKSNELFSTKKGEYKKRVTMKKLDKKLDKILSLIQKSKNNTRH